MGLTLRPEVQELIRVCENLGSYDADLTIQECEAYSAVPKNLKRKSFRIVKDLTARYPIPLLTDRLTL